jgi:hypothetical protein
MSDITEAVETRTHDASKFEEIHAELEYLERILDSIESWTLAQAAKARIERLREELKRRGVVK